MPHRSSVPMSWRLSKHRYGLVGSRCPGCSALFFPPRAICKSCGAEKTESFRFSGNGVIVSYTTIYAAPEGFEKSTPYNIGLVKLDEGPVITTQVVDKNVSVGSRVRVVFRKISEGGKSGLINYGFKFELV
ncbi:MAG: Zn-ribbon domain-containing OB-fold protein [Candidatus Aenigmarchaeota archaeon]|nr:Zn-ribbon domain-containing OB-fold protein [Candidatus Aenigmarchaeota archaeon]